jgi:hypothetical protein
MRRSVLSLCAVVAGAVLLPLGLRAVNAALPDAGVGPSYVPTVETPRPREPFDEAAAAALREAQPEYVVIGDSMAGVRIDPRHLSRATGRSVAGLFRPGSPVAYWYLQLKNLVADNRLTSVRGAVFFFRDDQLTSQVEVTGPILDPVARESEPELDRIFAAYRLGAFSDVHRTARAVYQFDRTRNWLEPRLLRAPAAVAARSLAPADLVDRVNTELFALERLRRFEAADLPVSPEALLDFDAQVERSILPEILRVAERAGLRLAFIHVQRRPTPQGPAPRSAALERYLNRLQTYLTGHGAYYYDDRGDPDQPLSVYADGDHLRTDARPGYTERFARRHAAFFQ